MLLLISQIRADHTLQILKKGTEFFSTSTPPISSVISTMDTIDQAFTTASIDDEDFCLPIKVALELGKWLMNKYYNLTDESEIYRTSICMLSLLIVCYCLLTYFIVLHLGLKTQYFKDNKWQQDWQDKAITITQRIFDKEYQDSGLSNDTSGSSVNATQAQQSGKVSRTAIHLLQLTSDIDQYLLYCNARPNGRIKEFSDRWTVW